MIVMKFGGSSVADRSRMEHVARVVSNQKAPVAVVVSAMGKTTDKLLQAALLAEQGAGPELRSLLFDLERLHREAAPDDDTLRVVDALFSELRSILDGMRLLREQTPRSKALVASVGERLSAPILAAHLRHLGHIAEAVDARTFVITDEEHESARVDLEQTREVSSRVFGPILERGAAPIITGFIGATPSGITTVLGRGGSDYSAALVGNLLGAREIWIWTDVDGILTADPRLVREARTLEQVSYREAAEMSYFGAKVLHPKTIGPAVSARIPIRIKNTFSPERQGTLVMESAPALAQGVKTVSSIHNLALVTIEGRGMAGVPGVARRVFEASETAHVNVIMISQASSEQTISFVVPTAEAERLVAALRERFSLELAVGQVDTIAVEKEIAIVSIVGEGMAGTPGISGKLFGSLGAVKVNVLAIAQGASELSISVAIREGDVQRAVRAIHSSFGLTRVINLMILGCGRVGSTLLRLLEETRERMEMNLGLELRLIGLANSRQFLLEDSGIAPQKAVLALSQGRALPSAEELITQLEDCRFTDLILIDLTAADTTEYQKRALEAGIHVVSANKRPLSASLVEYEALHDAARRTGAHLQYETTFGAGLPVLHTLKELLDTGDRIQSITGCFSGTLGFICSRMEEGMPLAEAVRQAQIAGLTEPDPREDLSGRDVARKALIIARTAGIKIDAAAITLEPLLEGLEQGLENALEIHEQAFAERVRKEAAAHRVLRYAAEITPTRVRVGLQSFAVTDPIGSLRGQDNILVYRTDRYSEFPLIIRGPGAGAEVTAAGVLGDVLKVARR